MKVDKFNKHNRNGKLDKNETVYKGSDFIKFKRVMARLEAQLAKTERERKEKKHGKGNDR